MAPRGLVEVLAAAAALAEVVELLAAAVVAAESR
jgi:hypothetical protein